MLIVFWHWMPLLFVQSLVAASPDLRKRRDDTGISNDEDDLRHAECSVGCLNKLIINTDSDNRFVAFTDLSRLGTIVPQKFIVDVDVRTFQDYCQLVYLPVRECLISCSANITKDILRKMTMLETICTDDYEAMVAQMTCMKTTYQTSTSLCESHCLNLGSDESTTINRTLAKRSIAETSSEITILPNETMAVFCLLLECVCLCDLPMVEQRCGNQAKQLELNLINSLMSNERSTLQKSDASVWPTTCDRLTGSMTDPNGVRSKLSNSLVVFPVAILLPLLLLRTFV